MPTPTIIISPNDHTKGIFAILSLLILRCALVLLLPVRRRATLRILAARSVISKLLHVPPAKHLYLRSPFHISLPSAPGSLPHVITLWRT
jgi:hypothetical protein